jgi:hypothetical protein
MLQKAALRFLRVIKQPYFARRDLELFHLLSLLVFSSHQKLMLVWIVAWYGVQHRQKNWRHLFKNIVKKHQPDKSPEPTTIPSGHGFGAMADGAGQSAAAAQTRTQRDPALRTTTNQPSGLTANRPKPAQTVRPDLCSSRRQEAHFNPPSGHSHHLPHPGLPRRSFCEGGRGARSPHSRTPPPFA